MRGPKHRYTSASARAVPDQQARFANLFRFVLREVPLRFARNCDLGAAREIDMALTLTRGTKRHLAEGGCPRLTSVDLRRDNPQTLQSCEIHRSYEPLTTSTRVPVAISFEGWVMTDAPSSKPPLTSAIAEVR